MRMRLQWLLGHKRAQREQQQNNMTNISVVSTRADNGSVGQWVMSVGHGSVGQWVMGQMGQQIWMG